MATVEEAMAIVAAQQHVGMVTVEVENGQAHELVVHYTPTWEEGGAPALHEVRGEELVRARWRWAV